MMIGCFSLLIALGFLITTASLFGPLWRTARARWWRPTSCTILSSELSFSDGGKGVALEIRYEYEVEEQRFSSSRYSFSGYSAALSASTARRVVDLLPAGSRSTCYVNPSDPTDVVLERRISGDFFFGLIPLAFTAGAIGAFGWLLGRRRRGSATAEARG
jgi:hypothetical protein